MNNPTQVSISTGQAINILLGDANALRVWMAGNKPDADFIQEVEKLTGLILQCQKNNEKFRNEDIKMG